MKAAVYKGIKQMACEERPKPDIVDDSDAIIRVVRACVCGSDLWFYRDGGRAVDSQTGHEAIGVVETAGKDVTIAKPGDFVIVPFPYSCGKCPVCKAGFESSCPPRRLFRRWGRHGMPGRVPARSGSRRHFGRGSGRHQDVLR